MEIQEELKETVLGKAEDEVSKSRKDPKVMTLFTNKRMQS